MISRCISQRLLPFFYKFSSVSYISKMPPKRKVTQPTEVDKDSDDAPKAKKTKREKDEANTKEKAKVTAKTESKQKEKPKKEPKAKKQRDAIPDVFALDFSNSTTTEGGDKWNMKFASWNVNGIRAWLDKNGHSYVSAENPDIFCVQETKCDLKSIPKEVVVPGYKNYWLSGDKDGYSGTGLYTKTEPIDVTYGIGEKKHDNEGRVITAEYDQFYFVTAYVPNAGRGLVRHKYRTQEWDPAFRKYLTALDKKKPVIMCGDLNVAHQEIDLANPKTNQKSAGFTPEEREEFTKLLDEGFIDSFRCLYPEQGKAFSYWTYMMNCRAKNIGWRLDYFVLSERLKAQLCDSVIRKDVLGSDHCPIVCFMHF